MLKRTPFHDFHVSLGAKMVEFAGWEMPIMYRSIIEEHGGRLWATPNSTPGATFHFALPVLA